MTTSVAKMNQDLILAGPVGSLDAYIHAVGAIPVLSKEDEQSLANRFRDAEDLDAARELVMAHLRFVVHIAKGYTGYGLPLGDLIQEGNVGLMKAVKRFDPDYGVRLVSFAVHWIRAEIHEFVLKNWRIVKVATTKAQRKLFFNLRKSKKSLAWLTHALLYLVTFAMPLTGWLSSSAANFPVSLWGWFTLPDLVAPDRALHEALELAHRILAYILAGAFTLHIAAAFYHQFVLRDGGLAAMLPGLSGGRQS